MTCQLLSRRPAPWLQQWAPRLSFASLLTSRPPMSSLSSRPPLRPTRRATRKPTGAELGRSRRWWAHRLDGAQTHYHLDPAVLVGSWFAGSTVAQADRDELRSLVEQVLSAVPGLDLEAKVHVVGRQGQAGLAIGALGIVGGWATAAELHHTLLAVEVGLICALSGLAVGTGAVKGTGERLASRLRKHGAAGLAAPPRRTLPPRRPGHKKKQDGSTVPVAGDYPLHARSSVGPAKTAGPCTSTLRTPGEGWESPGCPVLASRRYCTRSGAGTAWRGQLHRASQAAQGARTL